MNPTPVIRPSITRACASGEPRRKLSVPSMKPQEAIATKGKVRRPALGASFSRFQGPGRCAVAVLSMSKQEFNRLDVLLRVQSGRLRVSDACVLIGLQRRQVFRLLRGLQQDGATSLISKRRGRPSNHRLPAEFRTLALSIVHERYADFGPSLAAEKLAEHHGCSVSRETLP